MGTKRKPKKWGVDTCESLELLRRGHYVWSKGAFAIMAGVLENGWSQESVDALKQLPRGGGGDKNRSLAKSRKKAGLKRKRKLQKTARKCNR